MPDSQIPEDAPEPISPGDSPDGSLKPESHSHPHDHGHDHEHYPYPQTETSELAAAGDRGAVCPKCGSWQVVAGHLLDGLGQTVRFGLMYRQRAPGVSDSDAPPILALYCNACGEVTLTLG